MREWSTHALDEQKLARARSRTRAKRRSVDVGVIVVRGDEALFGLRRRAHGRGTWSFPGGHLEDDGRWSTGQPEQAAAAQPSAIAVVEHIHLAAGAGAPVRAVDAARAIEGVGLEGDRYASGRGHYRDDRVSRDLTLVEAEALEALAREQGIELAAGCTRRNLTTRGIQLKDLLGRRFWVGDVLCQGTRLCEPCQYLADLTGKPLLRPLVHRGGLRANILRGGVIRLGDSIRADR